MPAVVVCEGDSGSCGVYVDAICDIAVGEEDDGTIDDCGRSRGSGAEPVSSIWVLVSETRHTQLKTCYLSADPTRQSPEVLNRGYDEHSVFPWWLIARTCGFVGDVTSSLECGRTEGRSVPIG